MNDDFDFRIHTEQPLGFYILKALVHHGGRVDGDLGSHTPVGMIERVLHRDVFHLLEGKSSERSAGRGQDNFLDTLRFFPVQSLENCAVLAINGDDAGPGAFRFFKNQFPGYDERFLIGKRQVFTGFESGKSREQSGTSNHSGNNQVSLRQRSGRNRTLWTGNNFHIQIANKFF